MKLYQYYNTYTPILGPTFSTVFNTAMVQILQSGYARVGVNIDKPTYYNYIVTFCYLR